MMNELKEICYRLEGYTSDVPFDVIKATKNDDGSWSLLVKKEPEEEQEAENAN